MKILITGGHLSPALAVIDEIREQGKDSIVFVGRKAEREEIVKKKIPFYSIRSGRLLRIVSLQSFLHLFNIPLGFFDALKILFKEKPDKILSFGGYIALPVAATAFLIGIPIYTHEQTIQPGLTNRLIAFFSKKVFISFPETKKYFPAKKTILTGNPIRNSIFAVSIPRQFVDFSRLKKQRKCIYVTGGSLGSHSLNIHIEAILSELLKHYIIIHQVGSAHEYNDYQRLVNIKNDHYFVQKHFSDSEIGAIFSLADFVVSRSGANTIFELIATQKPAVLVPLPWSAHAEQQKHADFLKKNGTALIFDQSNTSHELMEKINQLDKHFFTFKKQFSYLSRYVKVNAAKHIVSKL